MSKYFGTDGFRGEAGITLTAGHAYKVGRFLGWYYNALRERNGDNNPAHIVIGKDTRRSSYMFEYSLVAGLTASGADAYLLHVTTTPSVAYIARVDDFDCGIMISASHNPYYDNGIKLIDCYGEKMPEETLLLVEDYIDGKLHVFDKEWPELPFAHREHIGCTVDYVAGRNRYMGYLISLGIYSFKGVKVGLDCANGASWNGQPNQSLRLYHVHGFLPKVATKSQLDTLHIRSICLTEADYNMLYNQPYSWPIASQLSFFRENICLFIGCSLSDPNIRRLLEITAYNPPKHYAILPMMYKSTDASGAVVPKQFTTKDRLQIENHFYRIGINILWVRDYSAIPEWLHKLNRSIV